MSIFKVNAVTGQLDLVNFVSDDPSPKLTGNLNTNGFSIISAAGVNIPITPGAGGYIFLAGLRWPAADGAAGSVFQTNGAGILSFNTATVPGGGTGATTLSGMLAGNGTNPIIGRTITGTTDLIAVANGTGAAGNPTISLEQRLQQTAIHGWNGCILESVDVMVTSDGAIITCAVEKNGGGDLTVVFSDGYYSWDTTPPDTIALTAGTDTTPQINYVYFLQSTKTLTVSTIGFPAAEHAAIATVICQSAASLQANGAYKVDVWIDDVTNPVDQGHISNINLWIRNQNATWISGVQQTFTITPQGGSPDNVIMTTTSGVILHLHTKTFPAFAGTPDVYVVNDSVVPFKKVTDLNALLTDSNGVSMSGKFFSLVLWGCVSESAGDCKLFCNLPGGSYNTAALVTTDASKYANYNIPADFKGTGFLIAQWNLRHQPVAGGTWTSINEIDLRGFIPNTMAGGSGAFPTEFLDNTFRILDDVDNTKKIAFQASGISTVTERTITMADQDINLIPTTGSYQASDGDLTALAGLGGTGIAVRSAADTWVQRSITQPAAGITISDGDGVAGNPTLALANDLAAVEGLAGTGIAVRSAADTWVQRSIAVPAAGIGISNGDGVAGNPTLALADDLAAVEGLATTGVASRTAASTWATSSITDKAVLVGNSGQLIQNIGPLTDGQLVIGSTGLVPVAASLTAGANITITPGAGSISIAAAASSYTVNVQTFDGTDNWAKPASGTRVLIECWGGGGGGAAAANNAGAGGGGGGSYTQRWMAFSDVADGTTATIGAGGVAVSSTNDGNNGGNTTFGSYLTAYFGAGGKVRDTTSAGAGGGGGGVLGGGSKASNQDNPGGAPFTGVVAATGGPAQSFGGGGSSTSNPPGSLTGGYSGWGGGGGGAGADGAGAAGAGGNSLFGGGGGGGSNGGAGAVGAGGTSINGGNGGAGAKDGATATNGTQPGGGGGSTENGTAGAGGAGRVIVTTF